MSLRKKIRYLMEYTVLQGVFFLMSLFPSRMGRPLGRSLGRIVGILARPRSRLAMENMVSAFPGTPPKKIREWVRKCWENLGESLWEFSKFPGLSADDYRRSVDVEGWEYLKESVGKGKGVIAFTAHYTNWEFLPPFISLGGIPTAVIGRRIKNPWVNDFIFGAREKFGVKAFVHKNAVRESIRWLKCGNVLGLLFDQRITDGGVRVPFLGRPAHTTAMAALLALRLGCPVHGIHGRRVNGKIKIIVAPAMDFSDLGSGEKDIVEAVRRMTAVVEEWVRRDPPAWLWIHDRWKI